MNRNISFRTQKWPNDCKISWRPHECTSFNGRVYPCTTKRLGWFERKPETNVLTKADYANLSNAVYV